MKKVSSEVRTTYTIELSAEDFVKVATGKYASFIKNSFFKSISSETSLGVIEEFMFGLFLSGSDMDFKAIAWTFEFDGWSNAGIYKERSRTYRMEVYNLGADSI